jgi:hypothetical protein
MLRWFIRRTFEATKITRRTASATTPEEKQANWSIDKTQSPDGKPEVVAANLVNDTVLIVRCKNQSPKLLFRLNTIIWAIVLLT